MLVTKRPVQVEAWHWLYNDSQEESPSWMDAAIAKGVIGGTGGANFEPDHSEGPRIAIATLEGLVIARPGDWIIRGVKGELYPCKPDIFAATYDAGNG